MKARLIGTALWFYYGCVNLALTLMVVASARADDCSGPGDCGAAPGNIAGATGIAAVVAIVGILAGVQALRGRFDNKDQSPCQAYLDAVTSGVERIKALEASRDAARSPAGGASPNAAYLPAAPEAGSNAPTRTVLREKLRALLGQPAAPAPAPLNHRDALQAAEAALAAERTAQAHRVAALAECEKQAGVVPLDPAALQSAIDDAKKHFEELQQQLNDEVAKQLSDLAKFDADYNDKWAAAMKASEDYMNRYPELLRDLEKIWEEFGNREWAKAVAEWVDVGIQASMAGVDAYNLGAGLVKGAMKESVEVAQMAARAARAEEQAAARGLTAMEREAASTAEKQAARIARERELSEAVERQVQAAKAERAGDQVTAASGKAAEPPAGRTGPGDTVRLDPAEGPGGVRPPESPTSEPPGRPGPRDPTEAYDDIPKSSTPREGHVTEYDQHAPYEDDPLIDHVNGKPRATDEGAGGGPLGPAGMRNPLDHAHVEIEAAETEARRVAGMANDAPGKEAYVEQMHRQYERGVERARNTLHDPDFRERIDPASLRKLEDAVKPENARSLEDFRRSAGLDPAPPTRSPSAHSSDGPPVRTPERSNEAWTDAETGGKRAAPANEPPGRTGPAETQRLDPRDGPGGIRPSPESPARAPSGRTGPGETLRLDPREGPGGVRPSPDLPPKEPLKVAEFDPTAPEPSSLPSVKTHVVDSHGMPTDQPLLQPGRDGQQQLEKMLGGYQSTQNKVYAESVNKYAQDMVNGKFDWSKIPEGERIVVNGNTIVSGHHRFAAAAEAAAATGRPLMHGPDAIIPAEGLAQAETATKIIGTGARDARPWNQVGVVEGVKPPSPKMEVDDELRELRRQLGEEP